MLEALVAAWRPRIVSLFSYHSRCRSSKLFLRSSDAIQPRPPKGGSDGLGVLSINSPRPMCRRGGAPTRPRTPIVIGVDALPAQPAPLVPPPPAELSTRPADAGDRTLVRSRLAAKRLIDATERERRGMRAGGQGMSHTPAARSIVYTRHRTAPRAAELLDSRTSGIFCMRSSLRVR